jgi:hypothetical protein
VICNDAPYVALIPSLAIADALVLENLLPQANSGALILLTPIRHMLGSFLFVTEGLGAKRSQPLPRWSPSTR